jgi:hypothetical protein
MRITDRIIQRTTLANLQLDVRKSFEAPLASTTGRRVRSASEDSIGASQVMQSDGSLRALEQYQQNVASGVHLGVCSAGMTASPRLGDASVVCEGPERAQRRTTMLSETGSRVTT